MPLSRSYINARAVRGASGRLHQPSAVIKQAWTDPAAAVSNGYSVSHTGAAAAGTSSMTLGGSLVTGGVGVADYAKNVVIVVTHGSAVIAMSGTITGTDVSGNPQTEAWSVTAGTTSKTFTGKKGFKTVTSITEVVAADASGNSIIAGTGIVFGLTAPLALTSPLKEVAAGTVVTTGTLVASSTTSTDDPRGSYSPSTAANGSNDYAIWYISDTPENDLNPA